MPPQPLARRNTGAALVTPASNSTSMPGFTSIWAISRIMGFPFRRDPFLQCHAREIGCFRFRASFKCRSRASPTSDEGGHPVTPDLSWLLDRPVNPRIKSGEGDDNCGIEVLGTLPYGSASPA